VQQLSKTKIKDKIIGFHHTIKILRLKFNHENALAINMDVIAVFFNYKTKTVEECGAKLVRRLEMRDEKRKITCVLTVTGEGTFLRPMIQKKKNLELESQDYSRDVSF